MDRTRHTTEEELLTVFREINGQRRDPRDIAREYVRKGIPIFTLLPESKMPVHENELYAPATADPERIEKWLEETPDANIAIMTGKNSGFFVLDVDGEQGERALRELETKYGELPITKTVRTGSGRHLYFKLPPNVDIHSSISEIGDHLDIRGEDGYVVSPESVHPNGNVYRDETPDLEPSEPPEWLVEQSINTQGIPEEK